MANHLKMAKVSAILPLRERGWPFRWIARVLGVHRDTVCGHVRRRCARMPQGKAGRRRNESYPQRLDKPL